MVVIGNFHETAWFLRNFFFLAFWGVLEFFACVFFLVMEAEHVVVWTELLTLCHFLFFNLSLVVSFYGWSSCFKTEKLQKNTFIKIQCKDTCYYEKPCLCHISRENLKTKRKKKSQNEKSEKKFQCLTRYILWNTIFDLFTITVMIA